MYLKLAFAFTCLAVFIYADDDGLLRERSGYYQGDILLAPSQMKRNGVPISFGLRWINNTLIYHFSPTITDADKQLVLNACAYLTSETGGCVKFRVVTPSDTDYVFITTEPKGCFSYVGRIRYSQQLNLQSPGCTNQDTIVHELLHALGFWHMQSDENRDSHVKILLENVITGYEHNFLRQNDTEDFGVGYDLKSVMHYSSKAFSKNGLPTIQAINKTDEVLGGPVQPSDILKLKRMYECP